MKSSCTIVVVVLFVLISRSTYAAEDDVLKRAEDGYVQDALGFMDECGSKELTLCFKEKAMSYVDNLPGRLIIGGGFSIKPNSDAAAAAVDRNGRLYSDDNEVQALPEETRAREDAIDRILTDRIINYLSTHTVEFKVPDAAMNEFKRSIEEARKKKNKKNNMMPLLMMFKLKAAALAAIALKTLAILAFKALLIAKIALTIMVIVGLKKLSDSKHHHSSTYEVVAHDDHHGHGHYRRSLEAHDLAYRGYKEDSSTSSHPNS